MLSKSSDGAEENQAMALKVNQLILLLNSGFNRCSFQLLMSNKDTKRTRVRLDRNVVPCSRPTTSVIGPLHECKKVCPCTKALPQSGIRAWIKQGRRKSKKRRRETGKTEARRLIERKAAQQNKPAIHIRVPTRPRGFFNDVLWQIMI